MAEDIKFRHTMPVQIRFSDVDQFGHMNNSVYFSLYDLAKTTYIKDVLGSADWSKLAIVVANINANFFKVRVPRLQGERGHGHGRLSGLHGASVR